MVDHLPKINKTLGSITTTVKERRCGGEGGREQDGDWDGDGNGDGDREMQREMFNSRHSAFIPWLSFLNIGLTLGRFSPYDHQGSLSNPRAWDLYSTNQLAPEWWNYLLDNVVEVLRCHSLSLHGWHCYPLMTHLRDCWGFQSINLD